MRHLRVHKGQSNSGEITEGFIEEVMGAGPQRRSKHSPNGDVGRAPYRQKEEHGKGTKAGRDMADSGRGGPAVHSVHGKIYHTAVLGLQCLYP